MGRRFDLEGNTGDQQGSGITALDLADLPQPLPKIMRMLLRKVEMTRAELREAVGAFSEPDQLNNDELDQALEALSRHGWIAPAIGQVDAFRVNLRRKFSNTADTYQPRRRGGTLAQGLWAALEKEDRSQQEPSPETPPESPQ